MKKVDAIRELLEVGYSPKEIAQRVPCSLSLAYSVRGRREMAQLKHQIAVLREDMRDFDKRLRELEGGPEDVIERMLARNTNR